MGDKSRKDLEAMKKAMKKAMKTPEMKSSGKPKDPLSRYKDLQATYKKLERMREEASGQRKALQEKSEILRRLKEMSKEIRATYEKASPKDKERIDNLLLEEE